MGDVRVRPASLLWGAGAGAALVGFTMAWSAAEGCAPFTSYDGFTGQVACDARHAPARPPSSGAGGAMEQVGIAADIRFSDVAGATALGYDIDSRCTCPDHGACRGPRGMDLPCDGPHGVDNAAGDLLSTLFQPGSSAQGAVRAGLVIRVDGYNGLADDPDVKVSLYNAIAVTASDGGAARFDDHDVAIADRSGVLTPAPDLGSVYVAPGAYVTSGMLVATFTDFPIHFVLPDLVDGGTQISHSLAIPLTATTLVGAIDASPGAALHMRDAQLVGRLSVARLLEQVGKSGLCPDSVTYAQVKQATCTVVDVPSDVAADGTDVACDAVSFAVGFRVVGVTLASADDFDAGGVPCPSGPPDHCP